MKYLFPKLSPDQYTNSIAIFGFAEIIKNMQVDPTKTVQIIDAATHYECITQCDLLAKDKFNLSPFFEIPANNKDKAKIPSSIHMYLVNMDEEKAKRERYKEDKTSPKPHKLYNHYWGVRFINKSTTPNKIAESIQKHSDAVKDAVYTYVEKCAITPISEIGSIFKTDPFKKLFGNGSPSQLTDPIQCKGTNGLYSLEGNANISNWFCEWMKWIGVLNYADSITTDGTVSIYTILPHNISLRQIGALFDSLRKSKRIIQQDGLKKDVMIYNHIIIECIKRHSIYGEMDDPLSEDAIVKIIHGITYTTYMNMGNAYSPIHQYTYKVPSFIHLTDKETCGQWIDAYENLSKVLGSCDVKKDSMELIVKYKDFIASDQLKDFLSFLAMHCLHLNASMKEKYSVSPLLSSTLSTFLKSMVKSMIEIIENKGFISISKAIKNATMNGRYAKGRGQQWEWEIHYTLPADLQRSSRHKSEFIAKLTEFISGYNREIAKFSEQHKEAKRKIISSEDISELMNIIDKYDPKMVCNLLLAYGSASNPKVDDASSESPAKIGDKGEEKR